MEKWWLRLEMDGFSANLPPYLFCQWEIQLQVRGCFVLLPNNPLHWAPPPPFPPGEQPFKLNTAGLWMLPSFCRMLWDLIARVFMALHHLCREREVEGRGGWLARIPAWALSENKDGRHESSLKWKPRYIDPRPVARLWYGLEILLLSSGRLAPEQIKTHWERTSSRVLSKMDSVNTGPLFKSAVRVKSFIDDIYAQPCPNVPLGFAEDGLNKRKQLVSASSLGQNTFFF